jgi:hypothetical protein
MAGGFSSGRMGIENNGQGDPTPLFQRPPFGCIVHSVFRCLGQREAWQPRGYPNISERRVSLCGEKSA